ncbi:MAG: hypothetical protein V3U03_13450 [Myxococcota bacterium]
MSALIRKFAPLVIVSLLAGVGCAGNRVPFRHDLHRTRYAITDQELAGLKFYVSSQIIAHDESNDEAVIILNEDVPGAVLKAGPDWLIVSFSKEGSGAPFALERRRDIYRFATRVEGRPGYRRLDELQEKILLVDGDRYLVVKGSYAFLLIDDSELEKLIKAREHLEGRTP